ncbi:hypothetical protein RP20_CCG012795 [Aedes albopictus]|nr:hypothetical protein RP20_CCG012795 [Aedes albopictus]
MASIADQLDLKCRLCLCLISGKRSTSSMDDETFRSKLSAVCNVLFAVNDQLPTKVCSGCNKKITDFHGFVELIRCNQEQLVSMILLPEVKEEHELILNNETSFEEVKPKVEKEESFEDDNIEPMETVHAEIADEDADEEDDNKSDASQGAVEEIKVSDDDRMILQYFTLNCDACPTVFETFKHLKQHCKKAHGRKPTLQCVKCNKSFQYKFKLMHHINLHLRPCKCEVCGKGFADQQALRVHHSNKHATDVDRPFKCEKCPQSFMKENSLKSHLKLHDRVDCPICKKNLSNVYNLKSHMSIMHSTEERQFICDVCGKEFKSRGAMDSHSVVHKELTREDGARCEICNVWISRKNRLRRHMIEIHESKEAECNVCHKTYPNMKAMVNHRRNIHGGQTFECEICGKQFKRSINLKEHRAAAHTGEKLYSCEFCGMEMNSNANLYQHRKNRHPLEWMEAKQKAARLID